MFGLFAQGRFLDADVEDWCLETWAWLMANLGGMGRIRGAALGLASRTFFPPTSTVGHERALYILECVKPRMGMTDWQISLEPVEGLEFTERAEFDALLRGETTENARGREAVIRYDPEILGDSRRLIAMIAFGLSRSLLLSIGKPIPGGPELRELASDLTVAYAGFGVFGADAAVSVELVGGGRRSHVHQTYHGYFSEETWAFVLAVFAALKGIEIPREQLADSVADLTRKAARYLKRNEARLAPLRAIA